ncbi:hypothetical protein JMF97_06410 [Micromonospora fiedleri]|uniref:Uncharacterized protein n=1 Tax=Micromonospora fiedleri TaxID=1157498 RepID=A0ABS1UHI3_9ACTN|nr:hypothetical protein [Micromonospora fiedleri]MBL6275790.1 hypothetical protein [Micromonospora fiedleri]
MAGEAVSCGAEGSRPGSAVAGERVSGVDVTGGAETGAVDGGVSSRLAGGAEIGVCHGGADVTGGAETGVCHGGAETGVCHGGAGVGSAGGAETGRAVGGGAVVPWLGGAEVGERDDVWWDVAARGGTGSGSLASDGAETGRVFSVSSGQLTGSDPPTAAALPGDSSNRAGVSRSVGTGSLRPEVGAGLGAGDPNHACGPSDGGLTRGEVSGAGGTYRVGGGGVAVNPGPATGGAAGTPDVGGPETGDGIGGVATDP